MDPLVIAGIILWDGLMLHLHDFGIPHPLQMSARTRAILWIWFMTACYLNTPYAHIYALSVLASWIVVAVSFAIRFAVEMANLNRY